MTWILIRFSFTLIEMHPGEGNLVSDEYSKVIYYFLFQSWGRCRPRILFSEFSDVQAWGAETFNGEWTFLDVRCIWPGDPSEVPGEFLLISHSSLGSGAARLSHSTRWVPSLVREQQLRWSHQEWTSVTSSLASPSWQSQSLLSAPPTRPTLPENYSKTVWIWPRPISSKLISRTRTTT